MHSFSDLGTASWKLRLGKQKKYNQLFQKMFNVLFYINLVTCALFGSEKKSTHWIKISTLESMIPFGVINISKTHCINTKHTIF